MAPGKIKRNRPDPIPIMILGRLAIDREYQGNKLGDALLREAILRVLQAADIAGIKAVLVHAISAEAKKLYVAAWANKNSRRWVFALSNAGANYFEDRKDLAKLQEIDWAAIQATDWQSCKEGKQAEFLLERRFPWELVERIGVKSRAIYDQVANALPANGHRPQIKLCPGWYY